MPQEIAHKITQNLLSNDYFHYIAWFQCLIAFMKQLIHNNHELSLMVGLLFYISDQMLEPLLFYSKMANRNNEALIKV